MRSVADLFVSRSCNETHWHRPVEGTFPPAASLSHLCHRLMPIVLRRPAPMELAELVAGATIKRRLRSKQTIQRRLTKKQPLSGNSLPQSSDPATERVPDEEEHPIVPDRIEQSNLEEHPVVSERTEPWRPLTENEKIAWNALSPEEKEVCDALVHRLHRELGHSDIRGMVDSLRQNRAHPTVLAAAKLMHCTACQESARMLSRPVTSGKVMEPGAVLQMDNFYWKHPLKEVHVKGTLLVDASSRAAVIRIWRTASRQELLGNVSASEARQMLQESWFKFYGRPETVMTDPEGCFRERLFREWLASKNVRWDPQPAEAAWRIGILDKVLDVLKNAATRAARRAPEDTSCEALFDDCTEAHNELHRRRGYSPFQLLIGRSPPGLPLDGDKQLGEVSASLTSDGRHRLHIQRECYQSCSVARGWRPAGTLFLNSSSSGVDGGTNIVFAERWRSLDFQQLVQELPKRNFVDLVGQSSPVEWHLAIMSYMKISSQVMNLRLLQMIQRCQKIRRCLIKHGPLHHMQRHQELRHQNLQKHHSCPKLNRVHPRHVLLLRKHPLFHSHRHRKPQQYHRQPHPHTWNYLQSQCLSLEQ